MGVFDDALILEAVKAEDVVRDVTKLSWVFDVVLEAGSLEIIDEPREDVDDDFEAVFEEDTGLDSALLVSLFEESLLEEASSTEVKSESTSGLAETVLSDEI